MTRFSDNSVLNDAIDSILWSDFLRRYSVTTPIQGNQSVSSALVSADVLKSFSVSPESLSAKDLYEQMRYLEDNQLDSRPVELAFWEKIASPLSTLVMLMLSLPFVFSSQRSGGAGQKIFIGIILGIGYTLVNRLVTQIALANGFTPALSAMLPLIGFLLIAVIAIRRIA